MKQERNLDSSHHMMICGEDKSLTHPEIECDIVTRDDIFSQGCHSTLPSPEHQDLVTRPGCTVSVSFAASSRVNWGQEVDNGGPHETDN